MDIETRVRNILKDLPDEASPRSHWPTGDPRKQTAIETRCFEDGATIYFDRLAPLQSWAPLAGMNMNRRTGFIATNAVRLALEANVKLNQSEIDAITESCAKNYKRGAWASPIAVMLTGAAVYHGRNNFRFPFYTPTSSWFTPHAFPTQRITLLKGNSAIYAWHAFRFMAYYPLLKLAATAFYSSVIRMSIATDCMSDKRLSRVNEMIVAKLGAKRKPRNQRAPVPQAGEGSPVSQPIEESDAARRNETYRRVGMTPPSSNEVRRAARQKQSSESLSTEQHDAQGNAEWSSSDFQQAENASQSSQIPSRKTGWFNKGGAPAAPPLEEQSRQQDQSGAWRDSGLFEDDAASPVSAATRRAEQAQALLTPQAQNSSSSGASSWDQVRRQARSDTAPSAKGDRSSQAGTWDRLRQSAVATDKDRDRPPPSDNHSYKEAYEADDRAKSQAQKEYDAMLEAERKGEANGAGRWR